MRVQYERAGGFGGPAMKKSVTIDTADLPAHEANELQRLVREAGRPCAVGPHRRGRPEPQARDQFYYRLTVEDQNQRHSVVVSDPDVPEKVRSLINWLHDRSGKD